jgi:hypothetical protein
MKTVSRDPTVPFVDGDSGLVPLNDITVYSVNLNIKHCYPISCNRRVTDDLIVICNNTEGRFAKISPNRSRYCVFFWKTTKRCGREARACEPWIGARIVRKLFSTVLSNFSRPQVALCAASDRSPRACFRVSASFHCIITSRTTHFSRTVFGNVDGDTTAVT